MTTAERRIGPALRAVDREVIREWKKLHGLRERYIALLRRRDTLSASLRWVEGDLQLDGRSVNLRRADERAAAGIRKRLDAVDAEVASTKRRVLEADAAMRALVSEAVRRKEGIHHASGR